MFSMIVAMDNDRVIGLKNTIPWRLSADLKYFKSVTMGKPIIMGRKTYDSIGRPLPGRRNIILSNQIDLAIEGCEIFSSLEAVRKALAEAPEAMIIGGEQVYKLFMPFVTKLYITEVDTHITNGDAFFSMFDPSVWREVTRKCHQQDEKNDHDYCFVVYERKAQTV